MIFIFTLIRLLLLIIPLALAAGFYWITVKTGKRPANYKDRLIKILIASGIIGAFNGLGDIMHYVRPYAIVMDFLITFIGWYIIIFIGCCIVDLFRKK